MRSGKRGKREIDDEIAYALVLLAAIAGLALPAHAETLGPIPVDEDNARVILRAPHQEAAALSRALQQTQAARSARKLPHLRVQVDPAEMG